jgi:AcrR family transcriptional regulator
LSKSPKTKESETKSEHPPEAERRRGPRWVGEEWNTTVGRIQDAAIRLVSEEGLDRLSWRTLGALPELDVTGTAPLYYFKSKVGLLGAIAEQGFNEMAARLRVVRAAATPGADALIKLAVECVRFGIENPHLYHAMHAAQLWHAPATDAVTGRRNWTEAARRARDNVFGEFVTAVGDAQAAGALKPISRNIAARVLTAVIDGYLFQTLDENVGPARTLDEHLGYVAHLVQVTLDGLTPDRQSDLSIHDD